jgi:hypothetical protein
MNLPQKAIVLDRRELLCRDHDYGDFAPFRTGGEYVEELESVHFRHHQVEQDHGWRWMVAKPVQGGTAVGGLGYRQAHFLDGVPHHIAHVGVILNEQDRTFAPE